MDKISQLLTRGVANIIPGKAELEKLLRSGKKLNVYLGIDPTAVKIHLGHSVPLRKLQSFAELGHNVIFLIGDFTALIGDTSDKDSERPVLTSKQIEENLKEYKALAGKILDFSKVKIKYNSQWLDNLKFSDIVELTQRFTLADFIGRELIKKRLEQGKRIGLHETLYPVMQGYDSYYMDIDIQVGGTDQTFNMQAGRTLQKDLRNKKSFILATEFIMGTDGRKMSKSWGNAIWLDDTPSEMYGKIMSIEDGEIVQYFRLATSVPFEEVLEIEAGLKKGQNPMVYKKLLGHFIVCQLHGKPQAKKAQEEFEKIFQKKQPQEASIPSLAFPKKLINIVDLLLLSNLVESRSEAKRLIEQKAVEINNLEITNSEYNFEPKDKSIIKIGKKKFFKIKAI